MHILNGVVALLGVCAVSRANTPDRVLSDLVPLASSVSEFKEMQAEMADTPQGGAVMFVQALMAYARGYDEFMTEAVSKTDLTGGELSSMDRYRLRRVLPYMARAYVDGAVPESCYALPNDEEIRLAFRPQEKYVGSVESGRYKVFIWSGDESLTARPLTLVRDSDGIWRATEFSSLVLPVALPDAEQCERNFSDEAATFPVDGAGEVVYEIPKVDGGPVRSSGTTKAQDNETSASAAVTTVIPLMASVACVLLSLV